MFSLLRVRQDKTLIFSRSLDLFVHLQHRPPPMFRGKHYISIELHLGKCYFLRQYDDEAYDRLPVSSKRVLKEFDLGDISLGRVHLETFRVHNLISLAALSYTSNARVLSPLRWWNHVLTPTLLL